LASVRQSIPSRCAAALRRPCKHKTATRSKGV